MRITEQEADEYLHELVQNYVKGIQNSIKVPLTQNQYDALLDLVYNIGPYNLQKRSIIILLNSGDYIGACNEFSVYNKSKGKVLQGLIDRRKLEQKLFKKGIETLFGYNQ